MDRVIKTLAVLYSPRFATIVVYMLQAAEYQAGPYIKWFWRTENFTKVMHRRDLVKTGHARLVLLVLRAGMLAQMFFALWLLVWSLLNHKTGLPPIALATFLITPVLWAHLIILPLTLARWLIVKPQDLKNIRKSKKIFSQNQALKIAVAGSYGKTTMKEMLLTVLSEGKRVAATPANKNVASEHARLARRLKGDEEVVIIEFGEGAPGDVARFAKTIKPDLAVITGLAPAHLDKYPNLEAAGEDIFSLADSVTAKNIYVNDEPKSVRPFIKSGWQTYDSKQAGGWKISDLKADLNGLGFSLSKANQSLKIKSGLIGEHQAGPLAVVAAIAYSLGLSSEQIERGILKIEPFEHRMQPRQVNGAWLIDDTYNGNIEGMRAGLNFLKGLKVKRKVYVTPGLVDQGVETEKVHKELGRLIAGSNPNEVVLMKHSVTSWIVEGLSKGGYVGMLKIEEDPLHFYNNIDQIIAAGDVVLMQNDWPDNYQ